MFWVHILTRARTHTHIYIYSAYFIRPIPASPVPGHSGSNPTSATTTGSCKLLIASKLPLRPNLRRAGGRCRRLAAAGAAALASLLPPAAEEAAGRRRCWQPAWSAAALEKAKVANFGRSRRQGRLVVSDNIVKALLVRPRFWIVLTRFCNPTTGRQRPPWAVAAGVLRFLSPA